MYASSTRCEPVWIWSAGAVPVGLAMNEARHVGDAKRVVVPAPTISGGS
jgi:hypothetical protein